jgi:OOP family OmpA-OmpF porin
VRARLPLALAIAGAFLVQTAIADPVGSHFEITPLGGATLFDGDLHVGGYPLQDAPYLGGRLGYQIHPLFAIEAAGGFTPTHESDPSPTKPSVNFYHGSGNLVFTPWSGLFGGPFLFAGGGTSRIEGKNKGGIEVGGGLRYWVTDRIGLRLETRQIYYKFEEPGSGSHKINHVIVGAGLVFALGAKARDTDHDGVPDRKDMCPETPIGATVDAQGCPKDSDGDGVLDGLDQCANTPHGCTVDKNGCPLDADGDGVCDGLDQCADTPKGATVDAQGCPHDSDGDGVWDGLDQCPDTPKGATVDAQGCPHDSDGDGVWDGLDQCPGTGAGLRVDAHGCPIEVIEKETELLDTGMIRLQNVHFESGKAELQPDSYAALDVVGQVLKSWPELQIEIGGHTDSRGSEAANQRLSEARAKAVLDYLTGKFPELKPEQFKVRGYGESRPVVPNNNELNMAKNRRVEFVVQNKDVLRREIERRRLLPKSEPAPADTTGTP